MRDGICFSCNAVCSLSVATDASLSTLVSSNITNTRAVSSQRTPVPVIEGIALLDTFDPMTKSWQGSQESVVLAAEPLLRSLTPWNGHKHRSPKVTGIATIRERSRQRNCECSIQH